MPRELAENEMTFRKAGRSKSNSELLAYVNGKGYEFVRGEDYAQDVETVEDAEKVEDAFIAKLRNLARSQGYTASFSKTGDTVDTDGSLVKRGGILFKTSLASDEQIESWKRQDEANRLRAKEKPKGEKKSRSRETVSSGYNPDND